MTKQIRVLHILYSMNRGGAETMIMNYYRHVNREIIQFDFIISEPNLCHYEDEILLLGGQIYRVPIFSKSPFSYIREINHFFKTHKEYQIVHAHTSAKNSIPLGIAKWNKIPVRICHSHNIKNEKGIYGIMKSVLKLFIKLTATDFMACSVNAGEWLYGKNFFNKNGILIKNVIDAIQFNFNPEIREQIRENNGWNSVNIIGHVARFDHQKNHEFVIDLFENIHKVKTNTILLLIGDGILKKKIEEKVSVLHLENSVFFKGIVNNISDYMQVMDVFILPSLYEGLPLTLIEAQASGLKCVVSKDVISDECNITGLVTFVSLKETLNIWTDFVISSFKYEREMIYDKIKKNGYDSVASSIKLQNFYISKIND